MTRSGASISWNKGYIRIPLRCYRTVHRTPFDSFSLVIKAEIVVRILREATTDERTARTTTNLGLAREKILANVKIR